MREYIFVGAMIAVAALTFAQVPFSEQKIAVARQSTANMIARERYEAKAIYVGPAPRLLPPPKSETVFPIPRPIIFD